MKKRTKFKQSSRKILVTTVATIAVAMSADLPETIRPELARVGLSNPRSVLNDAEIEQLVADAGLPSDAKERRAPHSIAVKRYTIQKGDSLGRIWSKFGGTLKSAKDALVELKSIGGSADVLRIGENLSLLISQRSGEIRGLRRKLSDGRVVLLRGTPEGELQSSITSPIIVEKERVVGGTIYSSFSKAAKEQQIPYQVVDELVDLFGNRIDFRRDLKVGDSFSVIYKERRTEKGGLIETGPIVAASFENEGKLVAAVIITGAKRSRLPRMIMSSPNTSPSWSIR